MDTSERSKRFTKQGKPPFLAPYHYTLGWVLCMHTWILCCSDCLCLVVTRLLQAYFGSMKTEALKTP